MTQDQISIQIADMYHNAMLLTKDMDTVLKNSGCFIPEEMPMHGEDSKAYFDMWKHRNQIYEYISRIESIIGSYRQFHLANLS